MVTISTERQILVAITCSLTVVRVGFARRSPP